jgi:hypothetical protein
MMSASAKTGHCTILEMALSNPRSLGACFSRAFVYDLMDEKAQEKVISAGRRGRRGSRSISPRGVRFDQTRDSRDRAPMKHHT